MTELRPGAPVVCVDGAAGGHVDAFVVDPVTMTVTHVVVAVDHLGTRVLLPLDAVEQASAEEVRVSRTSEQLFDGERFDEPDYKVPEEGWHAHDLPLDPGSYYLEPFASPLVGWSLTSHERVPRGEVAVRRGAEVVSSDGHHLGHIDEFLVDPDDGHITHVVVRSGLVRHNDVVVPVASARVDAGTVRLELTRSDVEALPHLPVRRHGHVHDATAS